MTLDRRLTAIFADILSPDAVERLSIDSDMESVDGWDSQSYVEIVMAIEAAFGVEFSTLDAARMNSIRSIYAVLAEKGVGLGT